MSKKNALKYLKKLHMIEGTLRASILSQTEADMVRDLRLEFIKSYRGIS